MRRTLFLIVLLLALRDQTCGQDRVMTLRDGLTWSHEDLSDWLRRYPGMYVQDYGVLGSPVIVQPWGMAPWLTTMRRDGVRQARVGDGLFDSNLQPPAELDSLRFRFGASGAGEFATWTRTVPADSPYTEIQIREGYYNYGSVDLAHGQPIYGRSTLEFTGRLVWYDGLRAGTSDARMNRVRGRYRFQLGRRIAASLSYGGSSVQANSELEARGARHEREEGTLRLAQADSFRTALNPRMTLFFRRDRERWNSQFNMRELVRGWQLAADRRSGFNQWTVTHEGSYADLRYPGVGDYSETTVRLHAVDRATVGRLQVQAGAGVTQSDASFIVARAEPGWLLDAGAELECRLIGAWSALASSSYSEVAAPSAWRGMSYAVANRPLLISPKFASLSGLYVGNRDGRTAGGVDRLLSSSVGARWQRGSGVARGRLLTIDRRGEFANQFETSGDTVTLVYARGGGGDKLGAAGDLDIPVQYGVRFQGNWFAEVDGSDVTRATDVRGYGRIYFERDFFSAPLTIRSHFSYEHIGRRRAVSDRGSQVLGPAQLVGFRLSATIHGVTLIWGVDNLLAQHYYILPGYLMIRKEEYLGVQWRLWL